MASPDYSLPEWVTDMLLTIDPRKNEEDADVSIQIRDCANPDAQAEVRQRIRGLIDAAHARYAVLPADDEDRGRRADQLREEVIALHLSLIGYAPTRDQLTECGIE